MNYLKIITGSRGDFEEKTNEFFRQVAEKGHRVVHTKYDVGLNSITGLFICSDTPRKQRKYEGTSSSIIPHFEG